MSMPVGCRTDVTTFVERVRVAMNIRHTVEQDWYLHPTKGWKRGQKRKRSEPVRWMDAWPRCTFRQIWKKY